MKTTKTVIATFSEKDHLKIKLFCAVRPIKISELVRTAVLGYIDEKLQTMPEEKRSIVEQRINERFGAEE